MNAPLNHDRLKPTLLIVEDDEGLQRQLKWAYDDYQVITASDRQAAIDIVRAAEPEVVTLDLGLPPDPDGVTEGFAALEAILALKPDTKIIVASGHGARESALKAIAAGAYDFYAKPVDIDQLGLIVRRAFQLHGIEAENRRLRKTCDQLSRAAATAGEVEPLREQNAKTQAELDKAHAQIRSLEDGLARERKEHEAALAALRRELAREPLQRREGQEEPAIPAHQDLSLLTAEERMLAFRQHLQEVHQRELEERSQNRLSARLSRLWHRTGPAQ